MGGLELYFRERGLPDPISASFPPPHPRKIRRGGGLRPPTTSKHLDTFGQARLSPYRLLNDTIPSTNRLLWNTLEDPRLKNVGARYKRVSSVGGEQRHEGG